MKTCPKCKRQYRLWHWCRESSEGPEETGVLSPDVVPVEEVRALVDDPLSQALKSHADSISFCEKAADQPAPHHIPTTYQAHHSDTNLTAEAPDPGHSHSDGDGGGGHSDSGSCDCGGGDGGGGGD